MSAHNVIQQDENKNKDSYIYLLEKTTKSDVLPLDEVLVVWVLVQHFF